MAFWNIFKKLEEEREASKLYGKQEAARLKSEALSLKALQEGDIPVQARHRLEQQAQGNPALFTSSFSPKEYLLARQVGYEPIGQVSGSAFISEQELPAILTSGECAGRTQADRVARDFAVERMRKEAAVLGADGVVGVRIHLVNYSWSEKVVEFTASGTAVRIPGQEQWRKKRQCPFASTLSGQEFWQLYQGGYWPVGLVMGNCSYVIADVSKTSTAYASFVAGDKLAQYAKANNTEDYLSLGSGINEEIKVFQDAFNEVRKLSMDRMKEEIKLLNGCGVVDVDVDYKIKILYGPAFMANYGTLYLEFVALGTAVVEREGVREKSTGARPLIVIDLAKRAKSNLEFDVELRE